MNSSLDLPRSCRINPAIVKNLRTVLNTPQNEDTTYEQNAKWNLRMFNREKEKKLLLYQSFENEKRFPFLCKENMQTLHQNVDKNPKNINSELIRAYSSANGKLKFRTNPI